MTIRQAFKSLQRTPVFAIAMILTLALGIASVGAMFAVVYGVLLAPLPYGAPDRLVSVSVQAATGSRMQQPPALYFHYQHHAQRLSEFGYYRTGNANLWVEGDRAAAERVTATWVSASMLPLLEVPPLLGRAFTADEARMGGAEAVILSEAIWRSRFNASPEVIGKTLMVNSVVREIVGVMPARFSFPTADTRVWLPVRPKSMVTVGDFAYSGVARLAPGATPALAQQELAMLMAGFSTAFPSLESGGSTATWLAQTPLSPLVVPLREEITRAIAPALRLLAAAAGLVLLVAWANVVNLMLIRSEGRALELSVRAALGASRLRTASHFFGEALLLGAISGALALVATYGAVRALVAFGPSDVPRLAELGVGPATVGFIALIALLSVCLCAGVPAFRVRRTNATISLADGARGHSAGKSSQRMRAGIIVIQIALALVVSISSALLLRTAHHLSEVNPGFDADKVTTLWTQLPFARYDDADSVAFYARLSEQVRRLANVRAAGLTMRVPLMPGEVLGQVFQINGISQTLPVNVVDDGYFAAMRIPLLAGRNFQRLELERGGDVMISQRTAVKVFGDPSGVSALGKRLTLAANGSSYTVIGVVGDVREQDLAIAPSAVIYRPQVVPIAPNLEPSARRTMALVVRSNGGHAALVTAIRQIVQRLDPTVPIFNVETMQSVVRSSTARQSLALTLMAAAAAITLALGAIGLYGVMAYMVALRTREFGVRIALGANPRRIARRAALRGLALTLSGVLIGFVMYAMAAPLLRGFLYGVSASDPVTLIGATLVLLATASLASWLPARRAARVDPVQALRAE